MKSLKYKGYIGSVEFDLDENILFGKLLHIRDLVTYEACDIKGLQSAFQEAVDDYLEDCKRDGSKPDVPFKGVFNVRVKPELHRDLVVTAQKTGCSLNEYVNSVLIEHAGVGRGAPPRPAQIGNWVMLAGAKSHSEDRFLHVGQGGFRKPASDDVVFLPKVPRSERVQ